MRAAGPDGGDLIASTARRVVAAAVGPLRCERSRAAAQLRTDARADAIARVAAAVRGDPSDTPARAIDFDRLAQRLQTFWADDPDQYAQLVARLRRRKAQRTAGGRHLVGHTHATVGGGAPPGSSNAMRHGRYSAPLSPLMHALGPQSRSVVEQAITRALEDALKQATFRFVRHERIEARTRVWARDFAWRKVITLLKDAQWYPADILDPLADARAAQRRRHADDTMVSETLRRILDPVFSGSIHDALSMPPPPQRPVVSDGAGEGRR
jgi:hypothetical protein